MTARAIGSGTVSFGLVSIPVKLYTAASSESIGFNLLHKKCGGRMKQQYFCPTDQEVVERNEFVRGFEYSKNQYVLFSDEELEALEFEKSNALEIVEFVPESTVDLVYIARSYYLGPDKGGDKAYHLLSESMTRKGRIAVGRYFTRGKEQLVLIRPYKTGLILHYVYYDNEVRAFDEVDTGATFTFKPIENDLADKLIEQLGVAAFEPAQYHDTYQDRLRDAVEKKVAGQEITVTEQQPTAQILDLFEALKLSLQDAGSANDAKAPKQESELPTARTEDIEKPKLERDETSDEDRGVKPPKKAMPRKSSRTAKPATG